MPLIFRRSLFALFLALFALQVANAQSTDTPSETPPSLSDEVEEKTKEAVAKLVGMLSKFIENLPQYQLPEVLENGDIIIRRKHSDSQEAAPQSGTKI